MRTDDCCWSEAINHNSEAIEAATAALPPSSSFGRAESCGDVRLRGWWAAAAAWSLCRRTIWCYENLGMQWEIMGSKWDIYHQQPSYYSAVLFASYGRSYLVPLPLTSQKLRGWDGYLWPMDEAFKSLMLWMPWPKWQTGRWSHYNAYRKKCRHTSSCTMHVIHICIW